MSPKPAQAPRRTGWRARRGRLAALGAFGAAIVLGAAFVVYGGGSTRGPGTVHPTPLPASLVRARLEAQRLAQRALDAAAPVAAAGSKRQILFGDLHVHTTFSGDAFLRSLPMLQGEGAHPPADACDFARFCSGLDFFALTDHAESITPKRWAEERETVRQCNAVAGRAEDPDLVVFAGWEWTQVGLTPSDHYGHKNVIFRDTDDAKLPARVIAATGPLGTAIRNAHPPALALTFPIVDFAHRKEYLDFVRFQRETAAVPECPAGVDERAMPADCREEVATPRELFDRLASWGFDSLVIPHGTTWGLYTPPGTDWHKQLTGLQRDPKRQFLVEVYSGHGNSEEYRAWDAVAKDAAGNATCPAPTPGYEPCCWRAGELVRARCGDAPADVCEQRVRDARARHLAAGSAAHLTVQGASVADWGDCGQCRDCFLPTYNYRPGGAAQGMLATSDFADPAHPTNQPWGFLASSDNHSARPGTGYKEYARHQMTETVGPIDETWRGRIMPEQAPAPESLVVDPARPKVMPWLAVDFERQSSFFLTGGLVAVHADGRNRGAIWDALGRREVYGTSGDRILLWFDLVDPARPMGSEVTLTRTPHFVVRAAGAFVQLPGCEPTPDGPSAERLANLCRGECNRPSDQRKRITRVEVVRIRPQRFEGESLASLIADPWKTLPCVGDGADGCRVEFDDPEFVGSGRDATYYVRAIEAPSQAVNGGGLRCERDEKGGCVRVHPCYGDYRTDASDECLAPIEERAWSSPIFVRLGSASAAGGGGR
jgi:hypothetical protein